MEQSWVPVVTAAIGVLGGVLGGGGAVWQYLQKRAEAEATQKTAEATARKDDQTFINDTYRQMLADHKQTIDQLLTKVADYEKSQVALKERFTEEVIKCIRLEAKLAACQLQPPLPAKAGDVS